MHLVRHFAFHRCRRRASFPDLILVIGGFFQGLDGNGISTQCAASPNFKRNIRPPIMRPSSTNFALLGSCINNLGPCPQLLGPSLRQRILPLLLLYALP